MARHVVGVLGGLVGALVVGGAVYAGSGCGGGGGGSGFDNDGGGSGDGGGVLGPSLNGDGGTGPNCAVHCSADLHQSLDCKGNVVTQCPPDKGCGAGGVCVDPCEAAKANGSTVGCDFYALTTGPMDETRGSCYAVLVANTWTSPISLTAAYGTQAIDPAQFARIPQGTGTLTYAPLDNGKLDPGKIAILFLSAYPSGDIYHVDCPVTPAITSQTAVTNTGLGSAFHITTTAPIVAYDIYPYGGAASFVSSASLLVPTPAWGTNYIGVAAYKPDPGLAQAEGYPYLQIVASEDDTSVTISPTAAIDPANGVAGTGAGQPATYKLSKGQYVQFQQEAELTGSPISADKPISVWGGASCMRIPVDAVACDSGHQQLLPVSTLGSEYVAAPHAPRDPGVNEASPWRIVGAVDGTQLTFDPPLGGAPSAVNSGQVIEISTTAAFVVRSQDDKHPFYISGHMTGASQTQDGQEGDPDYVNVVPPLQYLRSYLFLTDPTYANTSLVFTRGKGTDGQTHDVSLDCAGTLSGWKPIGGSGYEYATVDLRRNGAAQGQCDNGVHTAQSAGPFGLTVWGWDVTVSYAYPAGMSVQPINTVVVPPTTK